MKQLKYIHVQTRGLLICLGIAGVLIAGTSNAQNTNPHYRKALSDLRAANWLIKNSSTNWSRSLNEREAVKQIGLAIQEIKDAGFDDGKKLEDQPKIDETKEQGGRLHAALDFLRTARNDISYEEDNTLHNKLRERSIDHIDNAIGKMTMALSNTQ